MRISGPCFSRVVKNWCLYGIEPLKWKRLSALISMFETQKLLWMLHDTMCWLADVIMMAADGLAPYRCQDIWNHHDDWTVTMAVHKSQHTYHITAINSLWPSDDIWWRRSGSTFAQVMACCLTAPSIYLNNLDFSSVRTINSKYSIIQSPTWMRKLHLYKIIATSQGSMSSTNYGRKS